MVLPRIVATDPSGPTARRTCTTPGSTLSSFPLAGSSDVDLPVARPDAEIPVVAERYGHDRSADIGELVGDGLEHGVPEPHRSVRARGHDVRTDAAGERRGRDPVVVARQREQRSAGLGLEDARGTVPASRHDLLAVRAEGDASQSGHVAGEHGLQAPVRGPPDPPDPIRARARDERPVRAEGDLRRMTELLPQRVDAAAALARPHEQPLVGSAREDATVVGGDRRHLGAGMRIGLEDPPRREVDEADASLPDHERARSVRRDGRTGGTDHARNGKDRSVGPDDANGAVAAGDYRGAVVGERRVDRSRIGRDAAHDLAGSRAR